VNVVHSEYCANWHATTQVPNDTLTKNSFGPFNRAMALAFQKALGWHMLRHETKIVDLVKNTGVSRDVINKLLGRKTASTSVENAILIAAFYGKTVNQFIDCRDVEPAGMAQNVFELLAPEDQQMLHAQILGILRSRGAQAS